MTIYKRTGRCLYTRLAVACLATSLLLTTSCKDEAANNTTTSTDNTTLPVPAVISYDVIKEYPHDPGAFTEGLEYHDGFLYESTGQYGSSDVRKTDLVTGKVVLSKKMDSRYFGEGLTLLNGKIYQLTYREGKGFVYDAKTLKEERTFTFNAPEGWGMTSNGTHLIYDDGSNVLHFIDPNTFTEVKQLRVTDEHGAVTQINELELIKGYIYANQWQTDLILKIDTATGNVVARADLNTLRQRYGIPPFTGRRNDPEVLNGIAYDATTNRIFITGKNWPKLFEVKLDN
ncbi:MAG: glutaminyl-peptide cyclotransferase [Bacteroidota bacterium]